MTKNAILIASIACYLIGGITFFMPIVGAFGLKEDLLGWSVFVFGILIWGIAFVIGSRYDAKCAQENAAAKRAKKARKCYDKEAKFYTYNYQNGEPD